MEIDGWLSHWLCFNRQSDDEYRKYSKHITDRTFWAIILAKWKSSSSQTYCALIVEHPYSETTLLLLKIKKLYRQITPNWQAQAKAMCGLSLFHRIESIFFLKMRIRLMIQRWIEGVMDLMMKTITPFMLIQGMRLIIKTQP